MTPTPALRFVLIFIYISFGLFVRGARAYLGNNVPTEWRVDTFIEQDKPRPPCRSWGRPDGKRGSHHPARPQVTDLNSGATAPGDGWGNDRRAEVVQKDHRITCTMASNRITASTASTASTAGASAKVCLDLHDLSLWF
jgi:hypothetical protein